MFIWLQPRTTTKHQNKQRCTKLLVMHKQIETNETRTWSRDILFNLAREELKSRLQNWECSVLVLFIYVYDNNICHPPTTGPNIHYSIMFLWPLSYCVTDKRNSYSICHVIKPLAVWLILLTSITSHSCGFVDMSWRIRSGLDIICWTNGLPSSVRITSGWLTIYTSHISSHSAQLSHINAS